MAPTRLDSRCPLMRHGSGQRSLLVRLLRSTDPIRSLSPIALGSSHEQATTSARASGLPGHSFGRSIRCFFVCCFCCCRFILVCRIRFFQRRGEASHSHDRRGRRCTGRSRRRRSLPLQRRPLPRLLHLSGPAADSLCSAAQVQAVQRTARTARRKARQSCGSVVAGAVVPCGQQQTSEEGACDWRPTRAQKFAFAHCHRRRGSLVAGFFRCVAWRCRSFLTFVRRCCRFALAVCRCCLRHLVVRFSGGRLALTASFHG